MKTSNHHIYYAAGLSWDFCERLFDSKFGCRKYLGHNHRHTSRYRKNTTWNKQARSAIKRGKVDGINLKNYYAE